MTNRDEAVADQHVDEHALGALVGHLIRLTVGDLPPWVVDLSEFTSCSGRRKSGRRGLGVPTGLELISMSRPMLEA